MESPVGTIGETLRALAAPRRSIPILLVSIPMVAAQASLSNDPLAVPLAILLCASFVLLAPASYRVLVGDAARGDVILRSVAYLVLAVASVSAVGVLVPRLFGVGRTFLTSRSSLVIAIALFCVGGWGLGRDIDLAASLAREKARAEAMAVEVERAQLLALRSQLDPHFLFNTLNAIAEWCREDGVVAERAILELSSMLRTVMDGVRVPSWSLQRELALCDTLLSLHLIRDPELFSLERFVDEAALACEVPPMLFLPLVENAMKHGPAKGHRGAVRLSLRTRGDELVFELENPGRFGGERAGGDGLATLRRRLALAYGDRGRFAIGGDARTLATVSIPRAIAGASRPA